MPLDETRAWLALLRAPGLGASGTRELIGRYGNAVAAQAGAARDPRVDAAARAWLAAPDATRIDADLRWLEAPCHHLVVATSEDFPILLRDATNPPAALFVAGDTACLWSAQIAIVGSRSATAAGLANARAFAKTFAQAGNTVTSGLAEGVDGAAHDGALEGGGKTIAVLGTGPDIVFPRQHGDLAGRIVEHGALVSEFPPGTPGLPKHFPRRNRIIAGLSLGTLVVEASLRSGSLTTARLATEAGREVFALPGSIHSPLARGCHKLIRDGAKLVETAEEVIEELRGVGGLLAEGLRRRLQAPADPTPLPEAAVTRDADYQRLLGALDAQATALDELVERTGLTAAAVSSMLLVLELDGVVGSENGRYARR
ncbi:MAG: DNA-protecting protein DprA [Proteobacteria bacterium]|nr:DNA-protecting protein DprA [Pseudomonadota bacterium]